MASKYSALTFELDKPDDVKEKHLVEKAIQCNVQKLIEKYNKTTTNENKEMHLNSNQMCSDPIQYYESQFCIEVIINYEIPIKSYILEKQSLYLHNVKYITYLFT